MIKLCLELFLAMLAAGCSLPADVMFRSAESRTRIGGAVYNRVRFLRSGSSDVWMMNQSHDGGVTFERLAIVVDGKQASFYQLEPGLLEWTGNARQVEYRVSCAMCHSNGPRAVRPEGAIPLTDRIRIALWNLKIKMYPRLKSAAAPGFVHQTPFKFEGKFANTPLKVAICTYCHREDGPIARGTLLRQNAITIASMVDRGEMPPLGIPLVASQKKELEKFLRGL